MADLVTFDMREFEQAVLEISVAKDKEISAEMNRQGNNLCVHALDYVKKAEESAIQALQSLDFWPKYIASLLVKRGAKSAMAGSKGFLRRYKGGASKGLIRVFYTKADAQRYSKKIIRKRLQGVGFLRFFFVSLSKALRAAGSGGQSAQGKTFNNFEVAITAATPSNPHLSLAARYQYRHRSDRTAIKANAMLDTAMRQAIPATITDIRNHVNDILSGICSKHSAKRVA